MIKTEREKKWLKSTEQTGQCNC